MSYSTFIPALRQWLTPPTFPDKEQTRAARWLHFLILTFIILLVADSVAILVGLLDQNAVAPLVITNSVGVIINLLAMWLMRRGQVQSATIILLAAIYFLITYLNAIVFQSIHTFNVIAYFVLIPLVDLLLGRRSMNIFAILCIGTISIIFYFEWAGVLIPSYNRSAFDNLVLLFFAISLNTLLLNASIRRVEEQADEIHKTASALATTNQELQQSQIQLQRARADLEQKVRQRTQELQDSNQKLQDEIEARQQLLNALAASEANWRSLAEQVPDTIARINPDYTIAFINRSIGGCQPKELTGGFAATIHQQP